MKHAGTQGYAAESTSRSKPEPSPDVIRPAIHDSTRTFQNTKHRVTSTAVCKRRREHGTRPKSHSLVCSQFSPVLSFKDFDSCRHILIKALLRCTDLQFSYLSALFSSLLHCFRPLHQSEITRILHLLFATGHSSKEDTESPDSMFEQLQVLCENILRIDSRGFVHFALPTVKQFLTCYPIRGIDRSHFTLARACIAEIAAEQQNGLSQAQRSKQQTSFFAYAAQQWHRHYRNIQLTSPGLTGQVHVILQTQIARRFGLADDHLHQRARLEHARNFCQDAGLSILLEKYTKLLAPNSCEPFPRYPLKTYKDPGEEVIVVSEALARMSTEGTSEGIDDDWVLVT